MGSDDSAKGGIPDKPDILVIFTTQWRASAFGFVGDPNARTPHLDALAKESLRLDQAVTPHPFGVFARAAFLTGRRSPTNGIRDYYDPLPAGARTLAHAFSGQGYETAFFGKWQLYARDPNEPVVGEAHARIVVPEERRGGFDFWEGFESGFLLNNPLLHGTEIEAPTRFRGYQSDVLVERLERYRKKRSSRSKPLFALLSTDAPHPPYAAPAAGATRPDEAFIRLVEGTSEDPETRAIARRELAGYYSHIEATDRAIGRLVKRLKSGGDWENTLLVFTSAHGDMHGVDDKFRKGWPHEESVRVPLLASWPGRIKPRIDDQLLISLLDLGPSLLGLATKADPVTMASYGFHGQNLANAMLGGGPGPVQQEISMPSVPPFAQQCSYAWAAHRDREKTVVFPEGAEPFTLRHRNRLRFEPF